MTGTGTPMFLSSGHGIDDKPLLQHMRLSPVSIAYKSNPIVKLD